MNRYQLAKARRIAASLQRAADRTMEATTGHMLARCVAMMTAEEWRTVSFTAGVPKADFECKAATLAILRGRSGQTVRTAVRFTIGPCECGG